MPTSCLLWALVAIAQSTPIPLPPAMVAPSCVACQVDGERERGAFSADEWKQLEAGEVVTSEVRGESTTDSEQSRVRAAGIIRHPPERVWAVLTDFESRPGYMSNIEKIRIVRVEGNRAWIDEYLSFFLVDVYFRVINTIEPERGSIAFVLDKSVANDIAGTEGSWQLTPLANGRETLLHYRTWVDTGRSLPQFVETFLLQRSLPHLISEVRGEVDARARR